MDTKPLTNATDLLLATCSLEELPQHLKQCWSDERLLELDAKLRADTERRCAMIANRAFEIRGT